VGRSEGFFGWVVMVGDWKWVGIPSLVGVLELEVTSP
jgi:hypothetical protein